MKLKGLLKNRPLLKQLLSLLAFSLTSRVLGPRAATKLMLVTEGLALLRKIRALKRTSVKPI